ncbi:penicillin-binding transpeptidase domain-containing protein [Scopulibacillus cellulosilyticus]|uniref:Penicillin-binding transpeptidase domain-containing protein n=1 Tax=Scopulibacillus cellulosilyticus TaxID=2665665 RepID=A0ABW2PXD6_9BACL
MGKEKRKKRSNLPFRLNMLFLSVFLAFSILILRLGVVQIVKGEDYKHAVEKTQHVKATLDSPRGKIIDTNGKVLAGNKAELAVVYIRHPGTSSEDNLKIAQKLAQYINMDTSKVTDRDMKDYWILTHKNAYDEKLSKSEQKKYKDDPTGEYNLLLSKITKKDLSTISNKDKQVIAIKHELDQSTNLNPHTIKKGLSEKELALIGEHLNEFHGMIETSVDSKRDYPNGDRFYLGSVNDIPQEKIDQYLAEGYNRNSKVGVSNLEQQYENVLRGIPTVLNFTTKNGQPVNTPKKTEGSRGDDIQLTINSDLEDKLGKQMEKYIMQAHAQYSGTDSAYAVVTNPNTGALLALVGRTYDPSTGKFKDTSYKTVLSSFQVGSAVKGATVSAGYQYNAIPGTIRDMPIHYRGGGTFKSYTSNIGVINVATALEHSSNVYMGTIAGNMAGFKFTNEGSSYSVRVFYNERYKKAVEELRQVFSQFGLGANTGVDLPYESTGYSGGIPPEPGKIMQFAIGQFDTYTPLQLAQYISTIANGGNRIAPHFLESIHAPGKDPDKLGPDVYNYDPKILNHINDTPEQLDVIHEGLHLVTHAAGGTAAQLGSDPHDISAKTGTAQIDVEKDPNLYNKTAVAYAPSKNPQVAVSVVVPNMKTAEINLNIAQDAIDDYFDLQKKGDKSN